MENKSIQRPFNTKQYSLNRAKLRSGVLITPQHLLHPNISPVLTGHLILNYHSLKGQHLTVL